MPFSLKLERENYFVFWIDVSGYTILNKIDFLFKYNVENT